MTTTSTRAPRRDATENRGALLDAARALLNRDPSASLEAIAAEAGLSRRSVYGHFANRDDLLSELVTLGSQRVAGTLDGVSHPDPVVRLALIGARLWREVESVRVMAVIAVRGPLAS
ncbi:MAG: helix-turn-helix domain-containing protein, partial [Actinomycetota bacterium]